MTDTKTSDESLNNFQEQKRSMQNVEKFQYLAGNHTKCRNVV